LPPQHPSILSNYVGSASFFPSNYIDSTFFSSNYMDSTSFFIQLYGWYLFSQSIWLDRCFVCLDVSASYNPPKPIMGSWFHFWVSPESLPSTRGIMHENIVGTLMRTWWECEPFLVIQ
jgi:hypothetical protein